MTSRHLAIWLSVLAGLQVIAGASALPDLVPSAVANWIQIIVGAIDAGTAAYIGRTFR